MNWDSVFADRTKFMKRSTIREILKLTQQPDIISFAGGLPAAEFFPTDRLQEASEVIIAERGQEAFQYSSTEGMPELRQLIAERLSDDFLTVSPDNIIITSGSQQALDLLGRVLLNEQDQMIVENPTYLGALMAYKPYNLDYLPIVTDEDGIIVDELEPLLQQNPKAMYVIPNFQNPQGITLSLERRIELANALHPYSIPVIEDNPYGELRYSGEEIASLLQVDAHQRGSHAVDGQVIYVGTFSKVLTPGLRVAWIAGHEALIDKIVQAKQSSDLHTSTYNQFLTYEVAKDGFLDKHIAKLREVYRSRRDVMLQALDEHFPEEVQWTKPDGGLFLMVQLPDGMDATALLEKAIEQKVAYVPGSDFYTDGTGANSLRLNYSTANEARIAEGIKRLGTVLKSELLPAH